MNHDGRAMSERELEEIERDVFAGLYNDKQINRMAATIRVQKRVLRELFNLFHAEPLRLVSNADPIRNSQLAHLKELVSMESHP